MVEYEQLPNESLVMTLADVRMCLKVDPLKYGWALMYMCKPGHGRNPNCEVAEEPYREQQTERSQAFTAACINEVPDDYVRG